MISMASCCQAIPKEETLSKVLEIEGYKIVFEDNFDQEKLDLTTWINGYPTETRSAAYYTEDAVFLDEGNMIIRTNCNTSIHAHLP